MMNFIKKIWAFILKYCDKSIFELINLVLRLLPFVREYQGKHTRNCATFEHLGTGLVAILVFSFVGIYWKFTLAYLTPIAWFIYVPFRELVSDMLLRPKNIFYKPGGKKIDWKKTISVTAAQMVERTAGFVVGLPFYVAAWFL